MSDMKKVCDEIAAKYESKEPPSDWPCFGDDVEFTDSMNGKQWRGTVLRFHPFSPVGAYARAIWVVAVKKSLDTGEEAVPPLYPEWSVKYSEINRIIRKEPDNG